MMSDEQVLMKLEAEKWQAQVAALTAERDALRKSLDDAIEQRDKAYTANELILQAREMERKRILRIIYDWPIPNTPLPPDGVIDLLARVALRVGRNENTCTP